MLTAATVEAEIEGYQEKLLQLSEAFAAGERSSIIRFAQYDADALTCMLEEAPLEQRPRIDYLIDRFEALRISCMS